ncbi:MAG: hypothetical protein KBA85_18995, partial [Chloroflexi bacterium]|nr:hypothetical protein [Chloroflexota bacterium]
MKIVSYLVAAALAFFGFIFIAGSQGQFIRIVVGVILLGAAAVFVYMVRVKPQPTQTTIVQKIDLSGDVDLQQIRCQNCDAALSDKSIRVEAGAIFV